MNICLQSYFPEEILVSTVQCRTDRHQFAEHGGEQSPEAESAVHPVLQVAQQGREGPGEGSLELLGSLLHLIGCDVALVLQQAPPPPAPGLPSQPSQVVKEEGQGHGQGLEDSLAGDS